MRPPVDADAVRALAGELALAARGPTTIYPTGGATAVIEGWRASTVDVDLRLGPESDALLRRVATVKGELGVNIGLVSPPDFVPELPGWRERSPFVLQQGAITVRHFDPYSQALAKIERGFEQDLLDVRAMVDTDLIDPRRAQRLFADVEGCCFATPRSTRRAASQAAARARRLTRATDRTYRQQTQALAIASACIRCALRRTCVTTRCWR
ncbi:MAG: hypothetical protein ACR2LH_10495 [Thermoleophilaceae bacterium]